MGQPILPVLSAAVLVALIAAVFALWEASSRRRLRALGRAWSAYAAAKGLRLTSFAELSGHPSDLGPPLVHGEVQGVAIELTLKNGARPLTRVEATLPGVPPALVLAIERRRRHGRAAQVGRPLAEAPTGNKAFDAAFALLSSDPDLARSLLDRRLAQVVLGFPRGFVELSARENRLRLSWRGVETDPGVLDAAIEVVFTACRRRA